MNRTAKIVLSILGLLILLCVTFFAAKSSGIFPEGIEVFNPGGGLICIVDDNEFQDCYCPCYPDCPDTSTKSAETKVPPEKSDIPPTTTSITPTETSITPTETSITPTLIPTKTPCPTEKACYQWLCHKPDTPAEQDYCCDSEGCVSAHLGHGDYLGKCE